MAKRKSARPARRTARRSSAQSASEGAFAPRLKGKKVLICVGEFSEGMETYYLIYRMIEEGCTPVVAAPRAKRLQLVVHDFEPQYDGYTEKLGYQLEVKKAFRSVRPADYDGLLLPGGRAPEEIRQNEHLLDIVGWFLDHQRPLGAMCHGVMLLYSARPIDRMRLTAYPGIRRDIELLGGDYIDAVTSRGWPDLPQFMPEFIRVLAAG